MKNRFKVSHVLTTVCLALCILVFAMIVSVHAVGSEIAAGAQGDWEYEAYGDGVALTSYLGSASDVYVPATINVDGVDVKVLKLADGIFENNDNVNSVTIGAGITVIGARAFYDCDALVCILLPEELTAIGAEAFAGCDNFNSVILYDGVSLIGDDAFDACPKLTVWCNEGTAAYRYVSENNLSFKLLTTTTEPEIIEIDNGMIFYVQNGSAALIAYTGEATDVVVPGEVKGYPVVEMREVFKENKNIVSVTLPQGLKLLGSSTFEECYNLENIVFPESLVFIGNNAFDSCYKLNNVTFPNGLQYIGDYAFSSCDSFTEIFIPSSVKSIGRNAFYGCENVTELVISEGVESFDTQTFDGLGITEVTIPSTITVIEAALFQNCKQLTRVNLHEKIETIEVWAFLGCNNLRTILIPNSVTEIGSNVFLDSTVLVVYDDSYAEAYAINNNLLHDIYDGNNSPEIYESDNGFVCFIKNNEVYVIAYTGEATDVVVPGEVKGYPVVEMREVFKENKNIVSVTLPQGLKLLGSSTFEECYNLENIVFPESLVFIGNNAFDSCYKLNNVTFPNGLQYIGDYAFSSCDSFTEIFIPSSVKSIGRNAFYGCENVTELVISEGVESFDTQTFDGLGITEVTIPSTITVIEAALFQNCKQLTRVNLHEKIETIEVWAFLGCNSLRTILIPNNVTEIGSNVFLDSTILVVYPDSYAVEYAMENDLLYHVMQKTENPEIAYGVSVEGTVIKADGTAAAGATVEIYYADGTLKESVTADLNGKYSFTYAEVGSYVIKATLANGTGSTTLKVTRANVFDVFAIGDTDITLKNSYTVSGTVNVDSATVTMTDTKGNVIASVTTSNGSFSFAGIANGEYIITAETANGFASCEVTVFDGDVNVSVNVTLAGVTLYGYVKVEDRNGNQYAKAWVDVTLYDSNGNFVATVKTDADGKYTFAGLPLGEYKIVATTAEMRPDKDSGEDRAHELHGYGYIVVGEDGSYQLDTIIVSEDRGNRAEISGKVTAKGQTQVSEIILSDIFDNEIAKFNTKSNGKYKFTNIADGLYFITVTTESEGMGYITVIVRDGKVYGETDIKIEKSSKIENRENAFFAEVPTLTRSTVEQYRTRIADEKRFYDGLSKKEKNQLSEAYVKALNTYVEWLAECNMDANGDATVAQGGLVISGDELENKDNISFTINVEKQEVWESNSNGNANGHIKNNMKDKANGEIAVYYEITMTKTVGDFEKAITSVYKDTDAMGKFRITLVIPEEYRGYNTYSLLHVHCGEVVTLTDLDDNPDTITVEIDKFSTFALVTSEDKFIDESVTEDTEVDPEVESELKIRGASLSLSEDINIVYKAVIPENYTNAYMVFTFAGKDYTVYGTKNADGSYSYLFTEILPQFVGENIKATLYATNELGEQVSVCVENYSVRQYCINKLSTSTDAELKTMLSDLLVYAAAAQVYAGYNTDALVTDGLEAIMTPTSFNELDASYKKTAISGVAAEGLAWRSAGLRYENAMAMYLKFAADDVEGLKIRVTINGESVIFDADDFTTDDDGYYKIYFRGIYFTEFDDAVTAEFIRDGATVGETLTYSVNSYIYIAQNHSNTAMRDLMRATFNYGCSAKEYANN